MGTKTEGLTFSQAVDAKDELAKLKGEPPYDEPGNICYGDGYFAVSLKKKYGMSIEELEEEVERVIARNRA